jgi:hypothetical protein
MIFWSLCASIWFKNMKKMLLQTTSGFLQLESTLCTKRQKIFKYFTKMTLLIVISINKFVVLVKENNTIAVRLKKE